jgi:hypothetical protein
MNNKLKATENTEQTTNFHGAALIDEEGNEIPITEDMVQSACHAPEENNKQDSE